MSIASLFDRPGRMPARSGAATPAAGAARGPAAERAVTRDVLTLRPETPRAAALAGRPGPAAAAAHTERGSHA